MKKLFTFLFLFVSFVFSLAQWTPQQKGKMKEGSLSDEYFKLDIQQIKNQLRNVQESGQYAKPVEVSIPVLGGGIEVFEVYSLPVMAKELAEQYDLGSFVGVGIKDKSKYIRFSLAPNDFQSMLIVNGEYQFIQPYDKSQSLYRVHYKTHKTKGGKAFVCSTEESHHSQKEMKALYSKGNNFAHQPDNFAKSSDQKYRTMRLVVSVTGEYTQYFGGTVAGALTAINATMTRVNGIFEKDFALHLNIQNYPNVIYTNAATDPYSVAATGAQGAWNLELQQALTTNVGNANYDIGHLFGASGGGGNAGCIGCVCVNPTASVPSGKGSGYTSPADGNPQGDTFDVDYVAHEMGHQLGANHTFSHSLEGAGVNMEPGSGSTIMGYAGITGGSFTDVQAHSDAYFHVASLEQVQANLEDKLCDVETDITNTPPTIPDLPTYSIPKGTAFVLSADVTDAENDPMTFTWEEVDNASLTINKNNLGTTTSGASFRSVEPTTEGATRYFPKFESVLAGVLDNTNETWESVSTKARQSRFALTVRDNNPTATEQQTKFAVQTINVGGDGPFKIISTAVYNNSAEAFVWDVANTNMAPYNVANVKIDYSTNNGVTWNIINASTPNDGSENLQFTGLATGSNVIVRVSAIDNVFYALKNLPIEQVSGCSTDAPTGVNVSGITISGATLVWNPISGGSYELKYREVGTVAWTTVPLNTASYIFTGLDEATTYEVQIANICAGTTGSFSTVQFTTSELGYCDISAGNSSPVWISNVTVTPTANTVMSNNSSSDEYTDYTSDASKLIKLNIGSTGNQISVTKAWANQTYNFSTTVWIDFNRNGLFEDNEKIVNDAPNQVTPVNTTFDVPADAYNGTFNTRMRVIIQYNQASEACTSFTYGEVEDYAVKLVDATTCPTTAPLGLAVTNVTSSSAQASWTQVDGATYMVRYREVGSANWTEVAVNANTYTITGLSAGTTYEVQVANVCSGSTGDYSTSENFTTSTVEWCDVSTSNSSDEWIGNVTVTPNGNPQMSNDSGASNYTDYSSDSSALINLTLGSAGNQISVSKAWNGTHYSENVTAWIDFNRNGVFEDSEKIMQTPGNNDTPVTATFNVPLNAYGGSETTRMRVILKYGSSSPVDACTGYTYGEIEDYAVKFGEPDPCTVAPPTGLTVTNITASSAEVSWTPYSGAVYHIRYREVGTTAWTTVSNLALNTYTITGLNENTTYEVQVANTCNGTLGDFGDSVEFTTPTLQWCEASTTNTTSSWISNVSVNPSGAPAVPMTNDSGTSNYTDYFNDANALVTLVVGSTGNQISVSKAWGGSQWSLTTNVWIDFNRDGVFADDEKILTSPNNTNTPITGTFDVPANAYVGPLKTRMRVMVKEFSTPPAPCDTYTWGEVEDYAVEIKPAIPCGLEAPENLNIVNITDTSAEVSWNEDPGGATYVIRYKIVSENTWTEVALTTNTYTLTGLNPLTEYQIEVIPVCENTQGTPVRTTFETRCNPTPPTSLAVSQISTTSAFVSWDAVSDIGGAVYKLLYRQIGAADWIEIDVNAPTTSYTLTGLTPYTNYEVKVATECSGAINPYTTAVVFTTLPTCEMAPTGLTVTNISITQAQVDWDAYDTNAYVLRWRKVGDGVQPWNVVELTENTYVIQGLQEQTTYEVQIAKVCGGGTQTFTEPYQFTTPSIIYCNAMVADSTEYISNVTITYDPQYPIENVATGDIITEMDNDSEASPYTSYINQQDKVITLYQGSTGNSISVEKSWNATQEDEGVVAWIDFNRDGIFADDEMILQSDPSTQTPVTAEFAVPEDAYVSLVNNKYVVMRVAMRRNALPSSCGTYQYGEVEDYKVKILKPLSFNVVPPDEIAIYPNPATNVINITNVKDGDKFEIYTAGGRLTKKGKIAGSKVNISDLVSGVYVIIINTDDKNAQIKFIKE